MNALIFTNAFTPWLAARLSRHLKKHSPAWVSAIACALWVSGISAQTLSPPLGMPPVAAANAKISAPILELPTGQGPGVHGANSPFTPLAARDDVLAWSVLTAVKSKKVKTRFLPAFTPLQTALHQKTQRIQGYMMPLEPGEKQTHFLLSSVPLTCSFCTPGGPESMVEVRSKTPVKYTIEPVVVEGVFSVLEDDAYGLYYRMTGAKSVK